MKQEIPKITVHSAKEFRSWLRKNHKKESKVAAVLHKRHTGRPAPSHRELMEEAICFGWIDTTIKRVDEDTFIRHFSKRTKNSRWSDNTISYAKRLIKEGKMSEEGIRFFKEGLARPTHDHGIPKNPSMPDEIRKALSKDKKAKKGFDDFSPSIRRTLYRWFLRSKLPETKKRRLKVILGHARTGNKNVF